MTIKSYFLLLGSFFIREIVCCFLFWIIWLFEFSSYSYNRLIVGELNHPVMLFFFFFFGKLKL